MFRRIAIVLILASACLAQDTAERMEQLVQSGLETMLCGVARSKTNAGLAGLDGVASGAAGMRTSWRGGETALYVLQFVGCEISHGLLVKRKFVQLFSHCSKPS